MTRKTKDITFMLETINEKGRRYLGIQNPLSVMMEKHGLKINTAKTK